MRGTIQVNEMGSWRNVVSFEIDETQAAGLLPITTGLNALINGLSNCQIKRKTPTWRVLDADTGRTKLYHEQLADLDLLNPEVIP